METPAKVYPGPDLLDGWRKANDLSFQAIATALETSKTSVILWVQRKQRPEFPMRKAIAVFTRGAVPEDAWATTDERDVVDRVQPFTPPKPEAA